jgi:hypothetical protein
MAYEEVKMAERIDQERLLRERRMPSLKRLVRPYKHDALLPALPQSPHGQLHGNHPPKVCRVHWPVEDDEAIPVSPFQIALTLANFGT